MMLRPMSLALLTAGSLMLLAAPASAQRDDPNLKKYCTGDYMTYCGNFAPDSAELAACFKTNMTKFTPGCQAAVTAYEKKSKSARAGN